MKTDLMLALDLLILLPQVVTTINYPTDTLKLLATAADWQVVVVADKKTPEDWALENVIMLSIKQQEALKYTMMDLLPFNHYGYAFLTLSNRSTYLLLPCRKSLQHPCDQSHLF